jgi:hypothetical protein
MGLFDRFKRALGIKGSSSVVKEIKDGDRVVAAVLLSEEERATLGKQERMERFRQWQKARG